MHTFRAMKPVISLDARPLGGLLAPSPSLFVGCTADVVITQALQALLLPFPKEDTCAGQAKPLLSASLQTQASALIFERTKSVRFFLTSGGSLRVSVHPTTPHFHLIPYHKGYLRVRQNVDYTSDVLY